MSDIAIKVEGLSKRYKIGKLQRRHDTLRDRIADTRVFNIFKRQNGNGQRAKREAQRATSDDSLPLALSSSPPDTIWALKDVSFEVKRGEVVGVIGRNGAGKSTLLKILSRITEPTEGYADINGRVASLLEVGTGFHPELTGRENIYLNGSILGMKRAEINNKFDEIVTFAEIEKFIDTPVKYYSSGMYVRLAFAVAAHLEPEILMVDEVLSVGDAAFQKKCLGKMSDVAMEGRTVLFVSHSMPMIQRLCQKVVLLDGGHVFKSGSAHEVVKYYQSSGLGLISQFEWDLAHAPGNDMARLRAVRVLDETGKPRDEISIESPVRVEVQYELLKDGIDIAVQVGFYNTDGLCIFITQDINNPSWRERKRERGVFKSTACIPPHLLAEGQISVNIVIATVEPTMAHVHERDVVSFAIVDRTDGAGVRGKYAKEWPGVVRPMLEWSIEPQGSLSEFYDK